MSEERTEYKIYQPFTILQEQLNGYKKSNNYLRKENDNLRDEIQLLQNEINGLLACCSLEKKVDYKINEWLNADYIGNEDTDRQAFSIQLVDFIRKELQMK